MKTTTSDFVDVPTRSAQLGCALPTGLTLLPNNFESAQPGEEFLFQGQTATVMKVLKAANITLAKFGSTARSEAFIHNKSHDWALPIIFIGYELMKQNPDLLGFVLSKIQDYALDLFKETVVGRHVKAEVVIETRRGRKYKKISYEGDPSGLKDFAKVVKAAARQ